MKIKKLFDYDLFVIGGGSGGLASAKKAKLFGKKVGIADYVKPSPLGTKWGLGGTCVNVGCIPKKLLHHTSYLSKIRNDQKEMGFDINTKTYPKWEHVIKKISNHIKSLNFGYKSQLSKQNIDYINALASFKDPNTIVLKNSNGEIKEITAKNVLIAVGGRPNYLEVEGCKELCITSDDIFYLKKDPGKTLVIGAGYIALECGGFLKGLGKDVDVLHRSVILRGFDNDVKNKLVSHLKDFGIKFFKGNAFNFRKENDKIIVDIKHENEKGEIIEMQEIYDTVLIATSRTADLKKMNLEKINLKTDSKGKIEINEKYESSVKSVYAIGDCKNIGPELTPVAIKEGKYLAEGLFNNNWRSIDYNKIASTLFTPLEYSFSGLTEEEAIKNFGEEEIEIYHTSFKPLEWVINFDYKADSCYTKIIILKKNRKVLGIHYLGPNAGEVIQGYAVAVRLGLKYEDISDTIGIHPTCSEELVNLQFTKKENPDAAKDGC